MKATANERTKRFLTKFINDHDQKMAAATSEERKELQRKHSACPTARKLLAAIESGGELDQIDSEMLTFVAGLANGEIDPKTGLDRRTGKPAVSWDKDAQAAAKATSAQSVDGALLADAERRAREAGGKGDTTPAKTVKTGNPLLDDAEQRRVNSGTKQPGVPVGFEETMLEIARNSGQR